MQLPTDPTPSPFNCCYPQSLAIRSEKPLTFDFSFLETRGAIPSLRYCFNQLGRQLVYDSLLHLEQAVVLRTLFILHGTTQRHLHSIAINVSSRTANNVSSQLLHVDQCMCTLNPGSNVPSSSSVILKMQLYLTLVKLHVSFAVSFGNLFRSRIFNLLKRFNVGPQSTF